MLTARALVTLARLCGTGPQRLGYVMLDGPHRGGHLWAYEDGTDGPEPDAPSVGEEVTIQYVPDDQFARVHKPKREPEPKPYDAAARLVMRIAERLFLLAGCNVHGEAMPSRGTPGARDKVIESLASFLSCVGTDDLAGGAEAPLRVFSSMTGLINCICNDIDVTNEDAPFTKFVDSVLAFESNAGASPELVTCTECTWGAAIHKGEYCPRCHRRAWGESLETPAGRMEISDLVEQIRSRSALVLGYDNEAFPFYFHDYESGEHADDALIRLFLAEALAGNYKSNIEVIDVLAAG